MWLWFLAFLLLVVVWAGPLVLTMFNVEIGLGWQIALTLAILAFVALVLIFRWWRAGAAARALEREILKQSEVQVMNVRPDRRAEILELRQQMQAGIAALKRQGGRSLSALPWYVIVGPPGAGKTTALRQSGLPFAFTDPQGGALRGIGGTRNCDWWLTNEAIVLDTAGRYATQEDDRAEWFAFLDLLKRYRKARPVNGVIVAVSITDLADARDDGVSAIAKRLRGRVDEIMSRLDMVVPVYLMFTKVDLVDGFVEFWGELRKSERDQLFGATFPLRVIPTFDPARAFELEFQRLLRVLQAHSVRRVGREYDLVARRRIVEFPLEFRALERNLSDFVGLLFQRNRYQGTPLFRGFYFTSGTQEGSPVSRVLADMSRAFGLASLPVPERRDAKSYFVTDLFRRVIFPDKNLAGRTRAGARRHLAYQLLLAAGCVFASIAIVLPSGVSFLRNRSLVSTTRELVRESARQTAEASFSDERALRGNIQRLDELRTTLTKLREWDEAGPPLGMRWGMYSGGKLLEGVREAYAAQLARAFRTATQPELERALAAFTPVEPDTPAYTQAYDQLKLYLMLGDRSKLHVPFADVLLARLAAKAMHSSDQDADAKLLLPHAREYLDLVAGGHPVWVLDPKIVGQSRQLLSRAPQIERQYGSLIRVADEEVSPIRARDVFYGSIAPFVISKKGVKISGAYTKPGYELVMKRLSDREKLLNAEAWVLDEPTPGKDSAQIEATIGTLQEMYFARFTKAWREFFLDLQVKTPARDAELLDLLSALSEAEYPYQRLIRTLAENVRFKVDDSALNKALKKRLEQRKKQLFTKVTKAKIAPGLLPAQAGAAPEKNTTPIEDEFAAVLEFGAPKASQRVAPGLAQYLSFLTDVVAALTDARDTALPRERAVKEKTVAVKFEVAQRGTQKLLTELGDNRPLLSGLLLGPLERHRAP
jgi:type VI secretion system protein ImpL